MRSLCIVSRLRNKEVSSEVLEGSQSVVFDEAENRLHAQKQSCNFYLK